MKTVKSVYVNGKFSTPHGTASTTVISPLNGQAIAEITYADQVDTMHAIRAAADALPAYSKTTVEQRSAYLKAIHDEILKRIDDLVNATIVEYGAARERARWANVIAATTFLDGIKVLENYPFTIRVNESTVIKEPVGVAALFTPWNATAGAIALKVAAALAAGCTIVLKPSEFCPWQAEIIMECIDAAGLPAGVVNMVNGSGEVITEAIMASPEVTKISFTGSTIVGKILAKRAVDTMKRVTLELGGKSANIILADADLQTAVPMALQAAFMNNGQACIAGSRLFVPASKLEEVKQLLVTAAENFTVGDPREGDYKLGPLANKRQFERIQQYIQIGLDEGAELLVGGPGHPEGLSEGYYVRPTVFTGVSNDMRIAREEIFGPVLSVISYNAEQEAIEMANDSEYGLMAYISSGDPAHAKELAKELKTGRVLINTLKHDSMAPFGGYKSSGIGRENGGIGLEEFLEIKTLIS
ncbi:aldehyde dehydrogenase family protein [Chitinophaga agri]|uniref:aldehyde dehydrogenase (NAD(+)) n=1 Tax=Chitinophaga agri TaxID=2703787 RepID=A0A6B9Z826_9BACT|nr:aldehyde dehydrogenase family protein [Chitinophaga agri]QHS58392.1 aldehyde dehydrogenase family protein [Chitinophaga agri]